jgi:hypothetical protein
MKHTGFACSRPSCVTQNCRDKSLTSSLCFCLETTYEDQVFERFLQLSSQTMLDPYPWDRYEAVQYRSCVYFTEILILFVVEHSLKVDSHKALTTFTSKHCWIGVILATTSVLATSDGCRLSATIGFVSVTSTEAYIAGYYA